MVSRNRLAGAAGAVSSQTAQPREVDEGMVRGRSLEAHGWAVGLSADQANQPTTMARAELRAKDRSQPAEKNIES